MENVAVVTIMGSQEVWVATGPADNSVIRRSQQACPEQIGPVLLRDLALHTDVVPSCEPPSLGAASKPTN